WVGDDPRGDVCQQDRRADRATGDHYTARRRRGQEAAQRRRCPPQSRINGPPAARAQDGRLASPVAAGMRSAEIRCRKIQYVQPWYITVSGAISAVTHVMISRVYGVDE